MPPQKFRCYLVTKEGKETRGQLVERPLSDLPDGDVTVRVAYSSLNYKDALSATGHPGVTRKFPHVPGIDAAGTVVESRSPDWKRGDEVIVTGYDLGQNTWGGFAQSIRVPADWVVRRPHALTARESMILGTAGFTAALCLSSLVEHHIEPDGGEVVVTGASGGVGSVAVALSAKAGYRTVASTGKASAHDLLRRLGAGRILSRQEVDDASDKPLLPPRWSAAIDTVGGRTLATLVRSLVPGGCVTACGLVGGSDLPLTVYPFILRGVELVGIDSVECRYARRVQVWHKLAGDWKLDDLDSLATEVGLDDLPPQIERILHGQVTGRVIVNLA
ncbi:MAG: oxidoreductase [Planctomycetia bacterium 21-64-5]|nr:MAG: oxidoreductase [Planctomycetia bacterium 21-64-5]HQU41265.1 YhdH/YhfP family quinone oxidoreductase [Pirellulales bacterium]